MHVQEGLLLAGEEASGRSSAVADERTANVVGLAGRQAGEGFADRGLERAAGTASRHPPRISARQRERATSSVSRAASRASMRAASPRWARNSRNACAVVAKPPGTRTPAELADHFAEGGVLAADHLDIGHPQLIERYDQGGRQPGDDMGELRDDKIRGLPAAIPRAAPGRAVRAGRRAAPRRRGGSGGGWRLHRGGNRFATDSTCQPAPQKHDRADAPFRRRPPFPTAPSSSSPTAPASRPRLFGNSILNQFATRSRHVRRPFVDSADKAHQVVREINHVAGSGAVDPSSS